MPAINVQNEDESDLNSRDEDSYRRTQNGETAQTNDLNYSVSQMKSTKFYDKSLVQTRKDSQFDRDSDGE